MRSAGAYAVAGADSGGCYGIYVQSEAVLDEVPSYLHESGQFRLLRYKMMKSGNKFRYICEAGGDTLNTAAADFYRTKNRDEVPPAAGEWKGAASMKVGELHGLEPCPTITQRDPLARSTSVKHAAVITMLNEYRLLEVAESHTGALLEILRHISVAPTVAPGLEALKMVQPEVLAAHTTALAGLVTGSEAGR